MNTTNDFDPQWLLTEIELEEEANRLKLDEMRRRGEITIMPFGTYTGKRIDMIPDAYLIWAVKNCKNMNPQLRSAIKKHLLSL